MSHDADVCLTMKLASMFWEAFAATCRFDIEIRATSLSEIEITF